MNICVGIATRGRAGVLAAVIEQFALQTLQPASIVIACVGQEDVAGLASSPSVKIVYSRPGLARQRNAILAKMPPETEVVAFFDDDFVPHRGWLESAAKMFTQDPAVACITGDVLQDGIKGPGLTVAYAVDVLNRLQADGPAWIVEGYTPYGCNMAFRVSAIDRLGFDERLVLYGWLEDMDFGAGVAKRGRVIKLGAARGVHLGAKSGRVSGRRLGYSQMMNPVYMRRKGTMTTLQLLDHVFRNFLSNLVFAVSPEPYIDRRGRLKGNCVAFLDLLRRRITPERAESL